MFVRQAAVLFSNGETKKAAGFCEAKPNASWNCITHADDHAESSGLTLH